MDIETQVKRLTGIFGEPRIRGTLKKLAEIETENCSKKIERTKRELLVFEKCFNKNSKAAWDEFNKGKLGDSADIMEWMALYENLLDFQDQYDRINNSDIL